MTTPPDRTSFSPALIGFYASCALVSIGAATASVGYIVFGAREGSSVIVVVGVLMVAAGAFSALRCLRALRKES